MTTPFEHDIADQADALSAFGQASRPAGLSEVLRAPYERIVLTGMGSSHFAALPTWRRLVAAGLPAWWVDTAQLLDSPELLTPSTLAVVTSQSGASGEVVALLPEAAKATVVAVTNDPESPLARSTPHVLELHSGAEATVSTKSYLNTLAAHWQLAALTTGDAPDPATTAAVAAEGVDAIADPMALDTLARAIVEPGSRLAFVGFGDHAATALYAGLITKEAAKVPAEGFAGGQFRHGPLELAGPGLCAVLFGGSGSEAVRSSLATLAKDLHEFGSTVVTVGGAAEIDPLPADVRYTTPSPDTLAQLAHGAVVAQHLAVAVARAGGIEPGAFRFGNKITASL